MGNICQLETTGLRHKPEKAVARILAIHSRKISTVRTELCDQQLKLTNEQTTKRLAVSATKIRGKPAPKASRNDVGVPAASDLLLRRNGYADRSGNRNRLGGEF